MIHNYIGEKNLEKGVPQSYAEKTQRYTKVTLSLFASALCNFV